MLDNDYAFQFLFLIITSSLGLNRAKACMKILVVNGGSSSFKFALFEAESVFLRDLEPLWQKSVEFENSWEDRRAAIKKAFEEVPTPIDRVGHRIVHGGSLFQKPTFITPETIKLLQKLSHLAPLHNPINLEGIQEAERYFPSATQIGVFDTAFYTSMPEVAWTYPVPSEWTKEGIRRYGFHGISHQYCMETIQERLGSDSHKLITCHLGNGSSCTAILNGKGIDTTMGFTPLEGLMMGTRSGSIDPGIILYLQKQKNMTVEEVDHCLNKKSGLLGIGGSFDMRKILKAAERKDSRAILALGLYVHCLKKAVGALAATLNGLDILCFTGGIGENAAPVRQKVIEGLEYLGVKVDSNLNGTWKNDGEISPAGSKVKVFVVHVREEWLIAKECFNLR
ncbi:Acetate kinase [Neochlamydia sp. EPS4]|nr:Acetate kinase [Neochlamydia sp. EPS4]